MNYHNMYKFKHHHKVVTLIISMKKSSNLGDTPLIRFFFFHDFPATAE